VIYGSGDGLSKVAVRPAQLLTDSAPTQQGLFGMTLSAWNFGRNQTLEPPTVPTKVILKCTDLAVGVPAKLFPDRKFRPVMHLFYGTQTGLSTSAADQQEWTQDSPGVPGNSSLSNGFGTVAY
jgi:hypothetical protein